MPEPRVLEVLIKVGTGEPQAPYDLVSLSGNDLYDVAENKYKFTSVYWTTNAARRILGQYYPNSLATFPLAELPKYPDMESLLGRPGRPEFDIELDGNGARYQFCVMPSDVIYLWKNGLPSNPPLEQQAYILKAGGSHPGGGRSVPVTRFKYDSESGEYVEDQDFIGEDVDVPVI